ncbi:MAG: WYL domain-containing protein [Clostridia bacterium]|nr:WYL domain-containing protein [Clostridia bacterium]
MREFYVYGIKSREDYKSKSARTYDDEKRRMESWLGDHMSYVRTPEGKNVFISIDSRQCDHNPLYNAWKAKSFTDGDITLHFIIFDILHSPLEEHSLSEILSLIDEKYLSGFDEPLVFDESTVRKKLKEYVSLGMIETRRAGKQLLYKRAEDNVALPDARALNFFSEIAPCGVIGSFLLDKTEHEDHPFDFKHHYVTGALDSGVLAMLFEAMRRKSIISVSNMSRKREEPRRTRLIPLRIFISAQNGRQHLLAYQPEFNTIKSFRVDYLSSVKIEEPTPRFDELRRELDVMQTKMWGVNTKRGIRSPDKLERVEFTVRIEEGEEHIVRRLERERRIGTVERISDNEYRFFADVYDTMEMIPWIRTFICRIVKLNFSNRTVENEFKADVKKLYEMYGLTGGEEE